MKKMIDKIISKYVRPGMRFIDLRPEEQREEIKLSIQAIRSEKRDPNVLIVSAEALRIIRENFKFHLKYDNRH